VPDQSIPVAGRVHAHRPAAGNPEPAADPAPRIAVIRRVRDFAALGGEEAGGSKCIRGDDPVPYLLTVTPSGPEKLFFETVVVTLLIDKNPGSPANPVVTLTDTGKVVRTDLNGYAELPLDRRLKALPSELAKQILANWLDKFPPLLTSSQIEDRRKLYDRKVEIKHIKEVDRKRLDRNRLQLVLDQYDEEKGFLRKMRGDSPFVGALKGFIARIAGSALTDDEIEDLQLLMLKHNDVLLDSTSLSAEIYTELTKAIAEATDDTVYKSLLASHVKIPEYFEIGISSDQVFIDSTGQAQDVSQVRMLLEENVAFVNPVTKGPFDEKDIKRLCGYPSINLTIRSIENSLRDQKGRISAATVKEITKLIGPMDGFNKSPDGPNRWALAAAAFSEYASSLDHKSQTNLLDLPHQHRRRHVHGCQQEQHVQGLLRHDGQGMQQRLGRPAAHDRQSDEGRDRRRGRGGPLARPRQVRGPTAHRDTRVPGGTADDDPGHHQQGHHPQVRPGPRSGGERRLNRP
jgi:hypothetical protein